VSLVIARLAIRNGKATIGGGILSQTAGGGANSVTLSNVLLSGNKAIGTSAGTQALGGGIYADNHTTLAVRASTVTKNQAYGFVPVGTGKTGAVSAYGGGIFSAGTLKISASLISSNVATGGTYTKGRNTLDWTTVAFPAGGGGIESDGTMVMSHTTVDSNSAVGGGNDSSLPYPNGWVTPAGDGGGIRTGTASKSTISTSAITHNGATGGQGGLTEGNGQGTPGGAGAGGGLSLAGDVQVINTTIAGNGTSGGGGGRGTAHDYVAPHNVGGAAEGGGVSIGNGATVQLRNVTVAGNTGIGGQGGSFPPAAGDYSHLKGADGYAFAGGIMTFPGGTLRLASSIVAQNKPGSAGVPSRLAGNPPQPTFASPVSDCEGQVTSLGYNLIGLARTDEQGAAGCSGFRPSDQVKHSGIDPLLEPLGAYGGPTATMALAAGSPAIDAGTPRAGACAPADQRGFARVGRCDVGAFEYQPPTA
jgi:hypothetical protein